MPSYSSTDSLPFRRHDPDVAVANLFGLSADTTTSWNVRNPFPDFQPGRNVQLEAPKQEVMLPPKNIWAQTVTASREALERERKRLRDERNKPSKIFLGSSADGREFMMRSLGAEVGLRFHRW